MKNNLAIKMLWCLIFSTILFSCKKNNSISNINQQKRQEINSKFDFLPTSTSNQIIYHQYYTLSYKEQYEEAEWVAYELKSSQLSNSEYHRPFFITDPKVTTGSADWRNYKHSGYDKGHHCPAADMRFSENAYDDTFYTSNISPQRHDFNDGIWNRLEEKVRYWVQKQGDLFIITGAVLTPDLKTIGRENIAVPNYYYKVLLDTTGSNYKMIGFLVPAVDSDKSLYEFVVPVDEIEKMTGIDFFPKLDDAIENKLERSSDYKDWSFN